MDYSASPEECLKMFFKLLILRKSTTLWPDPEELLMAGSKIQCYETLRVASLSMGISTPILAMAEEKVRDERFLEEFSKGKYKGVLKRDYSMMCEHVILPNDPATSRKMKKSLDLEEITWKKVSAFFGSPKWFIQPIVVHLREIGEVRCLIVGGRLLSKITTTPGDKVNSLWQITSHEPIRPLHTHR